MSRQKNGCGGGIAEPFGRDRHPNRRGTRRALGIGRRTSWTGIVGCGLVRLGARLRRHGSSPKTDGSHVWVGCGAVGVPPACCKGLPCCCWRPWEPLGNGPPGLCFPHGHLGTKPKLSGDGDRDDTCQALREGDLHLLRPAKEAVARRRARVVANLTPAKGTSKKNEGGGQELETDEVSHEFLRPVQLRQVDLSCRAVHLHWGLQRMGTMATCKGPGERRGAALLSSCVLGTFSGSNKTKLSFE